MGELDILEGEVFEKALEFCVRRPVMIFAGGGVIPETDAVIDESL